MKRIGIALIIVNLWIVLASTAPQYLGAYVWHWFGFETELPLRHLLQVGINSLAVIACILFLRKPALLAPHRPRDPKYFLILLPLMFMNMLRGPLTELNMALFLVILGTTLLTGFWEEFLFRGLIQDRLNVMGHQASQVASSLLFSFIHWQGGFKQILLAFSIGLTFVTLRSRLGLWPLVFAHFTTDLMHDLFERQTSVKFGYITIGVYLVVGFLLLVMLKPMEETDHTGSHESQEATRAIKSNAARK